MQMGHISRALRALFRQWFHKRNFIIVSERRVLQIPIGGGVQFAGLMMLVACVCWASYSTGSFMAAHAALKEQSLALRTVTNARIGEGFVPMLQSQSQSRAKPVIALASVSHDKLFAHVVQLENKVSELEMVNQVIVERVRDKTSARIDDLESIIKQTGLSLPDLKKQAVRTGKAQGGPYLPVSALPLPQSTGALFSDLDELVLLRGIVGKLPLASPLPRGQQQSGFGRRIDPFNGELAMHAGLDLAGPPGSVIRSTGEGRVTAAGRNGAYGNAVDIDHGFGITTRYGHLSRILVEEGQTVSLGAPIGIQGSTGRSTGAHVHYEVRYNDQPMNPKNFLRAGSHVSEKQ